MYSSNPSPGSPLARPLRIVLFVLVLIGACAAGRSAFNRFNVERDNRRVEVAVDYAELRTIAAAEGVPIAEVLKDFKTSGITSVAVQEETVAGLQENRVLDAAPSGPDRQSTQIWGVPANGVIDIKELQHVRDELQGKTRFTLSGLTTGEDPLVVNQPWSIVRAMGVGLDPNTVGLVHDAGLGIVGRVGNWPGVTPQNITFTLAELKSQGVSTVLFSGDEVLGYKGFVGDDPKTPTAISTASELKRLGLSYGAIEFGKQKGDPELAKAASESTVRVHTIPGSEMVTTTEQEAVQRFSLAARERNIRVIFVRLFLDEAEPLQFNTRYVTKIVKSLERGKLDTGTAHGYKPLGVSKGHRLLIGIGVGAAFVLLLDFITGFLSGGAGAWAMVLALLGFASIAGVSALTSTTGPKLAALAAAVIFPALGLSMNDWLDKKLPALPMWRFLAATFVTVLGIVNIVGLLSDRIFLIKADEFLGVKATLVVPLLIVILVYCFDLRARAGRTFAQAISDATDRIARIAAEPVLVWQIVASVVALVVIVVVVARSGNESGVGVSGTELKIRALLDHWLLARPRFKDMFGHAAMIVALFLVSKYGRRDWALPLFLLGAFGQESLLDTFCHLHTPLVASVWRAVLGIIIGIVTGVLTFALLDALLFRPLFGMSTVRPAEFGKQIES